MQAEHAKKIADQSLTALVDALAQGKSAALLTYLAVMGRFHRYSFRNVCLIAMQRPDATRVAGYSAWTQLGRHVKKGEKGIVVVAPMVIKPDDKKQPPTEDGTESRPILRFRGVHVFDISQTDGEPLPELARTQGDPGTHLARLQEAIRSRGITLDHDDLPDGCDGVSRGGRISIRAGMPPAEEFAVTVHELAHELLHRDKEARAKGMAGKTLRETQAEAVAHVVCSAIGLEVGDSARDYIQLYEGDSQVLIRSLEQVQAAASTIIEAIVGEERALAQTAA